MILDNLRNTQAYEELHPLFKKAFDYLNNLDFENAEIGKTELKGKDLFVIISNSDLKPKEDAKIEVHDKYIDIQIPISKIESFGWRARAELKDESGAFDQERDIQFFEDRPTSYISVSPGNFIVFFPEDGHAPCIGEGKVKKIVVKIKIEY